MSHYERRSRNPLRYKTENLVESLVLLPFFLIGASVAGFILGNIVHSFEVTMLAIFGGGILGAILGIWLIERRRSPLQ